MLPKSLWTGVDLLKNCKQLKYFKGIFRRNSLPNTCKPKSQECGILNFDDADGPDTHWEAYYKNKNF